MPASTNRRPITDTAEGFQGCGQEQDERFGPSGPRDWQVTPASPLTEYSKTNLEIVREQLLRSETPKPEMLKSGTRHRFG
jgi:hypothetical protein